MSATTAAIHARTLPARDDRKGVVAFLVIAFGLAWLPFTPALFGHDPVALLLMPIAPAVAAVVVRRWVTREGFQDAGLRPNIRRWPYYALALGWPLVSIPLTTSLAVALGVAPEGFDFPWGIAGPDAHTVVGWILLSFLFSPVLFGEELGWRGYLQVRLLADRPLRAAAATGLIWGVWHLPMILEGGQQMESRLQALLVFPVFGVVFSIALGWLRERTGDVWAGSVAHASNNLTENSWWRMAFTGSASGVPSVAAGLVVFLAEAVVLLGIVLGSRLFGPRRLSREPVLDVKPAG